MPQVDRGAASLTHCVSGVRQLVRIFCHRNHQWVLLSYSNPSRIAITLWCKKCPYFCAKTIFGRYSPTKFALAGVYHATSDNPFPYHFSSNYEASCANAAASYALALLLKRGLPGILFGALGCAAGNRTGCCSLAHARYRSAVLACERCAGVAAAL